MCNRYFSLLTFSFTCVILKNNLGKTCKLDLTGEILSLKPFQFVTFLNYFVILQKFVTPLIARMEIIMKKKVILISIDGMRPDGLKKCGSEYLDKLLKTSSYTFNARTVFPTITLPCHLSMFHSVPPERHGTPNNSYVTPVRPIDGLFEVLKGAGKKCAMYYGWEPLRDIARPGSLISAEYVNAYSFEHTDGILTDRALAYIKIGHPDFVFLYMVETDEKGGHDAGWMSDTYLDYIKCAINNVKRVIDTVGDEYQVIVTADHGGHDRCHGTDLPEDYTIPMIFHGDSFEENTELSGVSILDIAPTIAAIMNAPIPREWEGKVLVNELN